MVSKSMLPALLQKQLNYVPESQPFFAFNSGIWRPLKTHVARLPTSAVSSEAPKTLHLITWNIDFMAPHPQERMASALSYLESVVSNITSSSAVVVFLQEMMESDSEFPRGEQSANDFTQICSASWIRERFHITDIDLSRWRSHYGQVTLVDRRLDIANVSRLHLISEYRREALLVDIRLASEGSGILRLCNVHLDSLYGGMRPVQWKGVAQHLQNQQDGLVASILAGDCNATQPRDKTEPQGNGFKDAYLELGGVEGDEEAATWGFQSKSGKRWGYQRLDKVVFWGDVHPMKLERIGVGIKIEDEAVLKELEKLKKLPFATDHYGLMCEFNLKDGMKTMNSNEQAEGT